MSEFESDRSLWKAASGDLEAGARDACLSAIELAAFAEGRGNESAEQHLAECAACLLAVREVRAIREAEMDAVGAPRHLIRRVQALVKDSSNPNAAPDPHRFIAAARRALAAAACVAVSIVGYRLGTASGPDRSGEDHAMLASATFGWVNGEGAGESDSYLDLVLAEAQP